MSVRQVRPARPAETSTSSDDSPSEQRLSQVETEIRRMKEMWATQAATNRQTQNNIEELGRTVQKKADEDDLETLTERVHQLEQKLLEYNEFEKKLETITGLIDAINIRSNDPLQSAAEIIDRANQATSWEIHIPRIVDSLKEDIKEIINQAKESLREIRDDDSLPDLEPSPFRPAEPLRASSRADNNNGSAKSELLEDRDLILKELRESIGLMDADRVNREKYLDIAEARWLAIIAIHEKLALVSTTKDRAKDRQIEDNFREKMRRMRERNKKFETQPSVATRAALPLPIFSGEITAWKGWRTIWATYDLDPRLSEVEKFQYLRLSLKGKAAELVAHLPFDDNQYRAAMERLESRFGDPEKLKTHYINELRLLVATRLGESATTEQLQSLLDGLNNAKLALISLKIDMESYGAYISGDVLKTLPRSLTSRWLREKWSDREEPSLDMILKELSLEIRLREREETTARRPEPPALPRGETQDRSTRTSCFFCQQNHTHHRCTMNTPQARRDMCERDNRCFKCLGRSHRTEHCMARVPCRNCNSLDHSPALCLVRQRPANNPFRNQSPQRSTGRTVTIDTNINMAQTSTSLPTFTAYIKGREGDNIPVLGLIDSGSQRTFIKRGISRRADRTNEETEEIRINTFGLTQARMEITTSCDIWLVSQTGDELKLRATEMEFLAKATPRIPSTVAQLVSQRRERLADNRENLDDSKKEFDIIIGCDHYWRILTHETLQGSDESVACASKLGWIIFGAPSEAIHVSTLTAPTNSSRSVIDFKEFWSLEHMGVTAQEADEPGFLEAYQRSIKRDEDGRCEILFPFKDNRKTMETNKGVALARLNCLLHRMKGDDRRAYHEIFQQYIERGYIEEVDGTYTGICTYLPHRPVIKQEATSTKIRPVFDGSAHLQGRPSLNDLLETGPNLNPELLAVLLRFRRYKISWMADITQAFLQIGIQKEHAQIVRFIWVRNPDDNPVQLVE
ncbi:uncharacterized protein LOC130693087 [Daphnia carinata]|uniref:uncharacterized protein LOC130693087 n=1 Tax=Daphnia carinata TaxID=120202 RepID=UPI00257AA0BD|nr:uncharacterized protein LOC130693087 [Daphnia carinata]